MPKRKSYDQLSIVPAIIADTVCWNPYKGTEISIKLRDDRFVANIEALRHEMTQEQRNEFIESVDNRCRASYDAKADWFMKIAKGGNRGRDQLYVWVNHWLAAYLHDREMYMNHTK